MAVPAEIRAVERPRNTVVVDRGGNGPKRYAVVRRIGCRRVGTRNVPVNGPTVGHIVAGRYVPKGVEPPDGSAYEKATVAALAPELMQWAAPAVVLEEGDGLLDELLAVFDAGDAADIYCIACLRVARPGVSDSRLSGEYERSWVSRKVPGAQLSKSKVGKLPGDLGSASSPVAGFMRARALRVVEDHHVAIDGTLKQDNSKADDLSQFSRKARVKGTQDISVLYAFDVETGEPVCGKAYAGNVVDSVSYADFLEWCGLERGIVVGDKAFAHKSAGEACDARPGLRWPDPIKRDDKRISANDMYDWEGMLPGLDRDVKWRKADLGDGTFMYAFYDRGRGAKEEKDWSGRAKGRSYDKGKADVAAQRFGTVVFESDLDAEPEVIWRTYESRWEIELAFSYYKQALELDETRVQSSASVIGSEFVNFVATTITCRLVRRFDEAGLLAKYTYGGIMEDLRSVNAVRLEEDGPRMRVRTTRRAEDIVDKLGLELPEAA